MTAIGDFPLLCQVLAGAPLRVLAVGAHPDDIELGCFGTLLRFHALGGDIALCVLSDGEKGGVGGRRNEEARRSARLVGADLTLGGLPDTAIPDGFPTIGVIESVVERFRPSVALINSPNDTHQDHRNTARAALSATRFVHHVLFYQTPSSTRTFNPQVFVDITTVLDAKIRAIAIHESQNGRPYMADRTVRGLAEFLGLQIYRSGRYFEGFEVHQIIL